MKFQCAFCDISAKSYYDDVFASCKANGHEIIEMLDEDEQNHHQYTRLEEGQTRPLQQ